MLALRLERRAELKLSRRLDRLLIVSTAAALIVSLMPLAARYGWAFELTANFPVQYIVVDVLLAVVCALQRKRIWCLALAAAASFSALPVLPYLAFRNDAIAAAPVSRPTIKLLSANVLYENHSATRLLEIVRKESPDMVLLVEYTPEWAAQVDELRAAYPYRLEGPIKSPWGIAFFSRFAFDASKAIPIGPSYGVQATVRTPDGPLMVIGAHLASPVTPSRAAVRNSQLDSLAGRVARATAPVAVIGDFNITPYSSLFQDWLARTGLTDTRRGRTLSPSWPVWLPFLGIPIDHCAVSRGVVIVRHRGLPAFGSDHYPILAELELATPAPPASEPTADNSKGDVLE
jgi:endonuclease/exonuclease/phosphatase (EEP) superfamily protein YafD